MIKHPDTENAFITDMTRLSAVEEAFRQTPSTHVLYDSLLSDQRTHASKTRLNQYTPNEWRSPFNFAAENAIDNRIQDIILKWYEFYTNPCNTIIQKELIVMNHRCFLSIVRHAEALVERQNEMHLDKLNAASVNHDRLHAEHNERLSFYKHILDIPPERQAIYPPVYTLDHEYEIEAQLEEIKQKIHANNIAVVPDLELRVKLNHEYDQLHRFKMNAGMGPEHVEYIMNPHQFEVKMNTLEDHWRELLLHPLNSNVQHELLVLNDELITAITRKGHYMRMEHHD